ncbi:MAG: hypothetical protein EA001_11950 [Oscillatoriales cyanobacterium]|nr:MAG: hypothetical protein EA001_11950 [Oscillatoriales cyanobacterium]
MRAKDLAEEGSIYTYNPDRADVADRADEIDLTGQPDRPRSLPTVDSMGQPTDRWLVWGAIGVGAAISVAIHVGVLLLPMQKAKKPATLPLVNPEKPVSVGLIRSAGPRSTPMPSPNRSPATQAPKPPKSSQSRDRPAASSTANRPTQQRRSRPTSSPTQQPSTSPKQSPTPDLRTPPSPSGSPLPSPNPGSIPPVDPPPTPQGLPGLVGLDAGQTACATGQSCYSLPDNFSVHSVTPELIQNSLGSGVEVRELPSIYENTEAAREFEVSQPNSGQSAKIIGYYYVISTQVQGQVGAIIFG